VARRRYGKPSPAISTAGRGEQPRDPSGDESLAQPIEPKQEYGKAEPTVQPQPAPEPSQHFSTGLGEQMRAQQQHAQLAQLYAYINAIPNLSAPQRQFLLANPHGLYRFDLLHAAHQMAQAHGIVPDSDDYFRVLESAPHHYGHLPPQQPAQPAPSPATPPMPTIGPTIDIERTESHEPEDEPMAAHVSVSAPVSRGAEHFSGEYEPGSDNRVTLSKAEREHAEAAGVSIQEYAKQKLRMMKLKRAKVIKDE
jgi:hypothetical protein